MNIFATYHSPRKSALVLDDKRVVKMILESVQMLSTAIFHYNKKEAVYRPNHVNHPCTIWVRKSRGNYEWLLEHYIYLFEEYNYRYGKNHKCEEFCDVLKRGKEYIPDGELMEFADCAALDKKYDFIKKMTDRYRQCLVNKWLKDKKKPKWTGRNKPYWYYKFNDFNKVKKLYV